MELFRKRYPKASRRDWAKWRSKIDAARMEPWDTEVKLQVGAALILWLTEAAPQRFEKAVRNLPGGKTQNYLKLADDTLLMMRDLETRAALGQPRLMPMIMPPVPWHQDEDGVFRGGYLVHDLPLIRVGKHEHTAALLKKRKE